MMPPRLGFLVGAGACVTSDVKSRLCGSRVTCSARMLVERRSAYVDERRFRRDRHRLGDARERQAKSTFLISRGRPGRPTLPGLKPADCVTSYSAGQQRGEAVDPCGSLTVSILTPLPRSASP